MFSKILIPTDFSPASYKATKMGMDLCRHYFADLFLLHVYPIPSRQSPDGEKALPTKLKEMKSKMSALSKSMVESKEMTVSNVVLTGNIEEQILQFIKDHNFDLVIVGVNSNGTDNLLGSHTIQVIEHSHTPMLIVPNQHPSDEST